MMRVPCIDIAESPGPAEPRGYRPKIQLVAYEEEIGGRPNGWIFVAVPNERGRYIKTDRCVAEVSCPRCGSVPGEPCKSTNTGDGYAVTVCFQRRHARTEAARRCARGLRIDAVNPGPVPPAPPPAPPKLKLDLDFDVSPERGPWPEAIEQGPPLVRPKWRRCPVCLLGVLPWAGVVVAHRDGAGASCPGVGTNWAHLPVCEAP